MAIDNTKLAYSSEWDVDEILDYKDSTTDLNLLSTLGSGGASLISINHSYGSVPRVIAQYNPDTQSAWYEPGENLQFSTSNQVTMDTWVDNQTINFYLRNSHVFTVNVQIRYWVLSDGY